MRIEKEWLEERMLSWVTRIIIRNYYAKEEGEEYEWKTNKRKPVSKRNRWENKKQEKEDRTKTDTSIRIFKRNNKPPSGFYSCNKKANGRIIFKEFGKKDRNLGRRGEKEWVRLFTKNTELCEDERWKYKVWSLLSE